jgi:hypothetical protein
MRINCCSTPNTSIGEAQSLRAGGFVWLGTRNYGSVLYGRQSTSLITTAIIPLSGLLERLRGVCKLALRTALSEIPQRCPLFAQHNAEGWQGRATPPLTSVLTSRAELVLIKTNLRRRQHYLSVISTDRRTTSLGRLQLSTDCNVSGFVFFRAKLMNGAGDGTFQETQIKIEINYPPRNNHETERSSERS